MKKSIALVFYYLFMIYEFNTGEPLAFVMLFSLIMELVLLIFIFGVFAYLSPVRKDRGIGFRVLTGAFPILIFQFTIAWWLSSSLHEFYPDKSLGPWAPFVAFGKEILISLAFLLGVYGLNVYEYVKKGSSLDVIKKGLLYQALLISLIGLTGIFFLGFSRPPDKVMILSGMAIGRIVFDYLVNWKLNDIFSGEKGI